jgi:putative phage-type endonuclease
VSADQGTPEWLMERCGKVTASRMADVMATIKTGEAASRANYRAELVAQRLTGQLEAGFTNAAMQWGTEQEPFARASYEIMRGVFVEEVGFVPHPQIMMAGASPDGLVGSDGMVEIKCPNTATHIAFLLDGKIPQKYQLQMAWQMACCGRQWVDYASFDPRMPEYLRLKVVRYAATEAGIPAIEAAVRQFIAEVDSTVAALENLLRDRRKAVT